MSQELAAYRAWFEAFVNARFNEAIARDATEAKLDRLADQALAHHREDRARDL